MVLRAEDIGETTPKANTSAWGDFGNWASGAQALGSLIQGWSGLKMASAAREQNRLAEMFGRANYDTQARSFNERLETRARSRRNRESFDSGGKSIADVMNQYGARTLDGNTVVGRSAAPSPAQAQDQAQVQSAVSPTAGLPTRRRNI